MGRTQSARSSAFSPDRVPRGPAMELPTAPPYRLSTAALGTLGQPTSCSETGQYPNAEQFGRSPGHGRMGPSGTISAGLGGRWDQPAAWRSMDVAVSGASGGADASYSVTTSGAAGGFVGWGAAPSQQATGAASERGIASWDTMPTQQAQASSLSGPAAAAGVTGELMSSLPNPGQDGWPLQKLTPEQADWTVAAWASGGGAAAGSSGGGASPGAGAQLLRGASPYSPAAMPVQGLARAAAASPWQRGTAISTSNANSGVMSSGGYPAASGRLPGATAWTAASPARLGRQGTDAKKPPPQVLPDVTSGLQSVSTSVAAGVAAAPGVSSAAARAGLRPGTLPGARSWLTGAPPPSLEGEAQGMTAQGATRCLVRECRLAAVVVWDQGVGAAVDLTGGNSEAGALTHADTCHE